MKLGFSQHIFEKSVNIKYHEDLSIESWTVAGGHTDGQTDRHDMKKLMVAYSKSAKAPKTHSYPNIGWPKFPSLPPLFCCKELTVEVRTIILDTICICLTIIALLLLLVVVVVVVVVLVVVQLSFHSVAATLTLVQTKDNSIHKQKIQNTVRTL